MADFAAVIPAYNAALTIEEVVRRTAAVLRRVLVVDDGSTDGTGPRAEKAGARVISHASNRGKGAALRTAFEALEPEPLDAVITLDADAQHDPGDIPLFQEAFRRSRADVIVGSRSLDFTSMSPGRRFGNRLSSSALRIFSGLRLPDSQSGFRLYSMDFLRKVKARGNAYDAEMELLLRAAAGGFRVESLALRRFVADGRAGSHFRPWLDTCRICSCVAGFSLRRLLPAKRR